MAATREVSPPKILTQPSQQIGLEPQKNPLQPSDQQPPPINGHRSEQEGLILLKTNQTDRPLAITTRLNATDVLEKVETYMVVQRERRQSSDRENHDVFLQGQSDAITKDIKRLSPEEIKLLTPKEREILWDFIEYRFISAMAERRQGNEDKARNQYVELFNSLVSPMLEDKESFLEFLSVKLSYLNLGKGTVLKHKGKDFKIEEKIEHEIPNMRLEGYLLQSEDENLVVFRGSDFNIPNSKNCCIDPRGVSYSIDHSFLGSNAYTKLKAKLKADAKPTTYTGHSAGGTLCTRILLEEGVRPGVEYVTFANPGLQDGEDSKRVDGRRNFRADLKQFVNGDEYISRMGRKPIYSHSFRLHVEDRKTGFRTTPKLNFQAHIRSLLAERAFVSGGKPHFNSRGELMTNVGAKIEKNSQSKTGRWMQRNSGLFS